MNIYIKYHDKELEKIGKISLGDWIDLRSAEDKEIKKGETGLISLGVSMKLPFSHEAHVVPRSSTFKNWGLIQTNSFGVIDNSYCGTDDVWKFPYLATRDIVIHKNDRICQFRIMPRQPDISFIETDKLDDTNRGGFGSTGVK